MPNRLIRNTAILAKIETTYGTDSVPTGGANALLVSNLSINPIDAQNVDRDIIRAYLGGSEQLLGTRYQSMSFDVEMVGAGTVAVAPAWGPLLRACGMAEVITATTRVDYIPVSTAFESLTIYWYDDGVLHKATGCRGNVKPMWKIGERPMLSFSFIGIYNSPTAVSNPSVTLTGWRTPQIVVDANTADLVFGGTHNVTAAPAITGGTAYPSQGIEMDLGHSVNFTPLLGGETVDITQRTTIGKIMLDVTAAQEVSLIGAVELGTLTTIGLIHGTVANQRSMLWVPGAQLINPTKGEINGKRMVGFDIRAVPVAGNDEMRIVTSF